MVLCSFMAFFISICMLTTSNAHPADVLLRSSSRHSVKTIESRLAQAAFSLLRSTNCEHAVFSNQQAQCAQVKSLPTSSFALHLAAPSLLSRYRTTLPDRADTWTQTGAVDAVLLLDPFPEAPFGHLVLLFWAELRTTEANCKLRGGVQIPGFEKSNPAGCLWWALKSRCNKRADADTQAMRTNFWSSHSTCEILFLPLVHFENDQRRSPAQKLRCHADVWPGFASCAARRRLPRQALCDPTQTNSQRCEVLSDVRSRCALTASCDHAVLLAGGWNDDMDLPHAENTLRQLHDRFLALGVHSNNIQMFFADGRTYLKDVNPGNVHAAGGMKVAFRQHIQRLCGTPHCLGTLVIYLHSPATANGDMLLWDMENDGRIAADELYSGEELRQDLVNCQAKRVHVLIDQSYAGNLAMQLIGLQNIAVYAGAAAGQHVGAKAVFTDALLERDLARDCLNTAVQVSYEQLKRSFGNNTSSYVHESVNLAPATLFGGTCGRMLSSAQPAGCHTLSLRIIMQRKLHRRRQRRRNLRIQN